MMKIRPEYKTLADFKRSTFLSVTIITLVVLGISAGIFFAEGYSLFECIAVFFIAIPCVLFGCYIGNQRTKIFYKKYVEKRSEYKLPKDL